MRERDDGGKRPLLLQLFSISVCKTRTNNDNNVVRDSRRGKERKRVFILVSTPHSRLFLQRMSLSLSLSLRSLYLSEYFDSLCILFSGVVVVVVSSKIVEWKM